MYNAVAQINLKGMKSFLGKALAHCRKGPGAGQITALYIKNYYRIPHTIRHIYFTYLGLFCNIVKN